MNKSPFQSQYAEFIFTRTYSRWDDKLGRRETWEETVGRYMAFMRENLGRKLSDAEYEEVADAILEMRVMPSMRLLWASGEAARKNNATAYNPVRGSTRVLTREHGMVEIVRLEGKTATVLNKNGEWAQATFNGYGIQPLLRVHLRKNTNTVRTVDATEAHRWVLSDGRVVSTKELSVGDKIDMVSVPRPSDEELNKDIDYRLGVIHGIVYGDGTTTYKLKRRSGFMIRLCDEASELLEHFEGYKYSVPLSNDGDPTVYLYDEFAKVVDLKALPSVSESSSYLIGFVRGWIAADGCVGKGGQVSIAAGEDEMAWIKDVFPVVGYLPQYSHEYPRVTNFGERKKRLWCVTIDRKSLTAEDFLMKKHSERFRPMEASYTIDAVEDLGESDRVFCATVPDTNTFVLEHGIVTGNCWYTAIDNLKRFREMLFLLCSGGGVGFSVEAEAVNKLPVIERQTGNTLPVFVIPDSREGWADALHAGIAAWYDGNDIEFNYEKIRPLGARLKTFGGRASGPLPLKGLLEFTKAIILNAQGRKLRPIEVHDICTKIAEVVVAGGTRRSSEISLSDLHDAEMRDAKKGAFYVEHSNRTLANNSVAYNVKPTQVEFMREWLSLMESGSGERGIFNREGAVKMMPGRRKELGYDGLWGVNPCAEINLRSCQACNLTSVVCRADDTEKTLKEKVRIATILGTYQSTLTEFPYLTKTWTDNCEEERLLGVSLNGQLDCDAIQNPDTLRRLREHAIEVNEEYAKKMKIKQSSAITCTKPEGTGSQMLGCSSGAHPRYAHYYIRRVRISATDPLFKMLRDQGVPCHPEVGQPAETATTWVLEFPVASPKNAITRHDFKALDQLEHWKKVKENWAEHTVSMTVYVGKDEWLDVGKWVWDNWDEVSGISFLPKEDDDHVYELAPYEELTKEQYDEIINRFPTIDFSKLSAYELEDQTEGAKELACVGGACEIDLATMDMVTI